jgi:hypothetical protein
MDDNSEKGSKPSTPLLSAPGSVEGTLTNQSLSGFRAMRDCMTVGVEGSNLTSPGGTAKSGLKDKKEAKPVRRRRDSHAFHANRASAVTSPTAPPLLQNPYASSQSHETSVPNFVLMSETTKFRVPCFGLFASLDEPCLEDLITMYNTHTTILDPLIDLADKTLSALLPSYTLLEWMNDPPANITEITSSAVVLWPLTTIYQLCSYVVSQQFLSGGIPYERFREMISTGGLLTLGKGILAAIAVASSRTYDEFLRNAETVIRASFLVGSIHESNNVSCVSHGRGYPNRYLMHVVNIPLHSLQVLVDSVNDATSLPEGVRAMSDVICSKVLSPRAAVLCGHPLDLCRLEKAILDFTDETGVKILKSFLRIEGPEHSEYYCRRLSREVYNAWVDNNIFFSNHDLSLEVFSPVDGHPLSVRTNLMEDLTRMVTYQSHNLMNSLGHVQGHDNIIDFGPGQLSSRVSFFLRWMNSQCEVICSPDGTVLPKQAPSPKRSSKHETRASTFEKCAVLNEILSSMTWEGKPDSFGTSQFVELSTSFLELGLLTSLDTKYGEHSPSPRNGSGTGSPLTRETSVGVAGGDKGQYRGVAISHMESFVMTGGAGDTVRLGRIDENFENLQICQRSLLTAHAVNFISELNQRGNMDFPPHALLLCKDVSALLEYWDTLEFVSRRFLRSLPTMESNKLISRAAARKKKLLHFVRSMFQQGETGMNNSDVHVSFAGSFGPIAAAILQAGNTIHNNNSGHSLTLQVPKI